MTEDGSLEVAQRATGLESKLLTQVGGTTTVCVERVGLPSAAVEREHELLEEPLPERELGDEVLELRDERSVTTACEVRIDSRLPRREDPFLEPRRFGCRPRLERDVLQRPSADQAECLVQERSGFRGGRLGRCPDEVVEPVDVGLPGFDVELVAALAGHDPPVAEHLAKTGNVDLDALPRRLRRLSRPDLLDEPVRRDCPATIEQKEREEGSLLRTAERNHLAVVFDLERPEQAELHRAPSRLVRTVFLRRGCCKAGRKPTSTAA